VKGSSVVWEEVREKGGKEVLCIFFFVSIVVFVSVIRYATRFL
jgi:hypothetical protein